MLPSRSAALRHSALAIGIACGAAVPLLQPALRSCNLGPLVDAGHFEFVELPPGLLPLGDDASVSVLQQDIPALKRQDSPGWRQAQSGANIAPERAVYANSQPDRRERPGGGFAMQPEEAEERRAAEGPSQFDVYVRELNGEREGTAIKQGFCWPACLFTWVWAFANRLWIPGAVLLTVMSIFNALFIYFSEESLGIAAGFSVIMGAIALYVGFIGNDLRRTRRLAEGFQKTITVRGTTPSQVLETAGIRPASSLAYSRGGVIAASIFSAVAVFFIIGGSVMFVVGDRDAAGSVGMIAQAGVPALLLWYRSLRPPMGFLKGLLWGGGGYLLAMPVFIMFTMYGPARNPSGVSSVGRSAPTRSLAVRPFASTRSDPEQQALADEITRTLVSELTATRGYHRVVRLMGSPQVSAGSRGVGVDWVVEGSVQRTESRVRLAVQLIYVPVNQTVWADSYDVPVERRTQVVRDVAARITSKATGTER